MDNNAIAIKILDNNTIGVQPVNSIGALEARLIVTCLILFCIMNILSIISIILNFEKKNKKRAIYQIFLSLIVLIGPLYIVINSICIFGSDSDLYMSLIILIIGNILSLINILKK